MVSFAPHFLTSKGEKRMGDVLRNGEYQLLFLDVDDGLRTPQHRGLGAKDTLWVLGGEGVGAGIFRMTKMPD